MNDQVWSVRESAVGGKHSEKTSNLVREFIEELEEIPDGCSELFPFELIEELRAEYEI